MIFTRTDSGLSNLRHFKGVDLVVFTEGGGHTSFSLEEALQGRYHKRSNDIEFWRPLFERFKPDLSVSFRALGAKRTLQQIARRLADGSLTGVCVVMDRDLDEIFSLTIAHHRVLYTQRYSWESDVFETGVIQRAFQRILLSPVSEGELEARVRPIVSSFRSGLRHLVRADIVCCAAGKPLFRRTGIGAVLQRRKKRHPPELNVLLIRKRLSLLHKQMHGFRLLIRVRKVSARRHCFGKLFMAAAIQIVYYLNEVYGQPPLRKEYCVKFLIHGFHDWLNDRPGSSTARYYARVVASV